MSRSVVPKVPLNDAPAFAPEFAKYPHLPDSKAPEFQQANILVKEWIDAKLIPFLKHAVNLGYTKYQVEEQWKALTRRRMGGALFREYLFDELKHVPGRHYDATPHYQFENKGKVTDLDITHWFMGLVTIERKVDYEGETVAIRAERAKEASELSKTKAANHREALEQQRLMEAKFAQDGDTRFEQKAADKPKWLSPPTYIKTPEEADKWLQEMCHDRSHKHVSAPFTEQCAEAEHETNWTYYTLKYGEENVQAWARSLRVFVDETLEGFLERAGELEAKKFGLPPEMYLERANWLQRNCPAFLNEHDVTEAGKKLEGKLQWEWKRRFESQEEKKAMLKFAQENDNWKWVDVREHPQNPKNKKRKPIMQTQAEAAKWRTNYNMDIDDEDSAPMDTSSDEKKPGKGAEELKATSFSARVLEYMHDLVSGKCGLRPQWVTTNDLLREDRDYSFSKWLQTKSIEISPPPRDQALTFGRQLRELLERRENKKGGAVVYDTTAPKFLEQVDTKTLIPDRKQNKRKQDTATGSGSKKPKIQELTVSTDSGPVSATTSTTASTEGARAFLERRQQLAAAAKQKPLFSKDKNIVGFAKPSQRDAYENSLYGKS